MKYTLNPTLPYLAPRIESHRQFYMDNKQLAKHWKHANPVKMSSDSISITRQHIRQHLSTLKPIPIKTPLRTSPMPSVKLNDTAATTKTSSSLSLPFEIIVSGSTNNSSSNKSKA